MGKLLDALAELGWREKDGNAGSYLLAHLIELQRLRHVMHEYGNDYPLLVADHWLEIRLAEWREMRQLAVQYGWPYEGRATLWLREELRAKLALEKWRDHIKAVASRYGWNTEQVNPASWIELQLQEMRTLAQAAGWTEQHGSTPAAQLRHAHSQHMKLRDNLRKLVNEYGWQQGDGEVIAWLHLQLHELQLANEEEPIMQRLHDLAAANGWEPKYHTLDVWYEEQLARLEAPVLQYTALADAVTALARDYGWQNDGSGYKPLDHLRARLRQAQADSATLTKLHHVATGHGWKPDGKDMAKWFLARLEQEKYIAEALAELRTIMDEHGYDIAVDYPDWLRARLAAQPVLQVQPLLDMAVNHGWPKEVPMATWLDGRLRALAHSQEAAVEMEQDWLSLRNLLQAHGYKIGSNMVEWLSNKLDEQRKLARKFAQLRSQVASLAQQYGHDESMVATPADYLRMRMHEMAQAGESLQETANKWRSEVDVLLEDLKDRTAERDSALAKVATYDEDWNDFANLAERYGWHVGDAWLPWLEKRLEEGKAAGKAYKQREENKGSELPALNQWQELQAKLAQAQATAHGVEALRAYLGQLADVAGEHGWQAEGGTEADWRERAGSVEASNVQHSLRTWLAQRLEDADAAGRWRAGFENVRARLAQIRDLAVEHGLILSPGFDNALLHEPDTAMAETATEQLRSWLAVRLKRLERAQARIGELVQERDDARQDAQYWRSKGVQHSIDQLLEQLPVEGEPAQPALRTCQLCTAYKTCKMRNAVGQAGDSANAHLPSMYEVLAEDCQFFVNKLKSD